MKRIFTLSLILALTLSCATDKKTARSSLPKRELIRTSSLILAQPQKAQEDLLTIKKTSAFNLRASDKDNHYILGVEGNKAQFRVLGLSGEDHFFSETKITDKELQSFLSTPKSVLAFGKNTLSSKAPFLYHMGKDGSIEANMPVDYKDEKGVRPLTLAFLINVESFNTLNFWDGDPENTAKEQMYNYDYVSPEFSNWYDPKVQKRKIESLLKVIRLSGLPEVLALQEIEHARGRFEHFQKDATFRKELEKLGYRTFILGDQEADNPMAITTAFVSRYPLKNLPSVAINTKHEYFAPLSSFDRREANFTARDIQVAELELLGQKLRFYNNHWKSQGCSNEESCSRSDLIRDNTAKILFDALKSDLNENPDLAQIVIGDLNTEYYTDLIKLMHSTGNEKAVQDNTEPYLFYNLWHELPVKRRWDASHEGFVSTLSQMLLNTNLYANHGFQYVDKSFWVVGQDTPAKTVLMNADSNPLRWQEMKYKLDQTTGEVKKLLEKTIEKRECNGRRSKARNCRISYTYYSGDGYSDHLSVQASFRFVGKNFDRYAKTDFKELNTAEVTKDPEVELVIEPCPKFTFAPYPDAMKFDFKGQERFRQCFSLNPEKPLPIQNEGLHYTAYVNTPFGKLGLSMMRGFDPRGLSKDGKMLPVPQGQKQHPMSNQCFERKILQAAGGSVKYAMGRMGLSNGIPTLFIEDRSSIELVDLPGSKKEACR